eukprot:scaffold41749_cov75-Phaeocystis_antarctica.AAC.3
MGSLESKAPYTTKVNYRERTSPWWNHPGGGRARATRGATRMAHASPHLHAANMRPRFSTFTANRTPLRRLRDTARGGGNGSHCRPTPPLSHRAQMVLSRLLVAS